MPEEKMSSIAIPALEKVNIEKREKPVSQCHSFRPTVTSACLGSQRLDHLQRRLFPTNLSLFHNRCHYQLNSWAGLLAT